MDISNLFNSHYYFDLSPEASTLSIFVGIYFVALIMLRAHLRILTARHKENKTVRKLEKQSMHRLGVIAILGLLTIIARHLSITLFGMRAIAYALILWSIYELWKIWQIHNVKAHEVVGAISETKITDKYLPRSKKKPKKKR